MLKLVGVLSLCSGILYLLFTSIVRQPIQKLDEVPKVVDRSYVWGLLFALLFYYGFPLWWWRYGFSKTIQLLVGCIVAGAGLQAILRTFELIEVDGLGDSFFVGLLLSMPIRAIAGLWVARRDAEWRSAILERRASRRCAMS